MIKPKVIAAACAAVLLAGCTDIENTFLNQIVIRLSGIQDSADYQSYEEYLSNHQLDENGFYISDELDQIPEIEHTVHGDYHITFAQNQYLNIRYFYDQECTQEIDTNNCYLDPGDQVYYSADVSPNAPSPLYEFNGFNIYDCGHTEAKLLQKIPVTDSHELLTIDQFTQSKELSIAPFGQFRNRMISVKAEYRDKYGNPAQAPLQSGVWIYNTQRFQNGYIDIGPFDQYTLAYDYDDNFFVGGTVPKLFSVNDTESVVFFDPADTNRNTSQYLITLYPYLHVSFPLEKGDKVKLNGQEQHTDNQTWTCSKIDFNDEIIIYTKSKTPPSSSCEDNSLLAVETQKAADGTYAHIYKRKQDSSTFIFDPNDYVIKPHGKLRFKIADTVITSPKSLVAGQSIEYEPYDVDPDYWLPDDNRFIQVGTAQETRERLSNIRFYPNKEVSVQLVQQGQGGNVDYILNGETITSDIIKVPCGSTIGIRCEAWNGWEFDFDGNYTYTVTEDDPQIILLDGKNIFDYFKESASHKVELQLVLHQSLGENIQFEVEQINDSVAPYHYTGGIRNTLYSMVLDGETVLQQDVFTGSGITLKLYGTEPPKGKAVRIKMEKIDENGEKAIAVQYAENLPETIHFDIYDYLQESAASAKYKTCRITASLVRARRFEQPVLKNAVISVTATDSGRSLADGDILDDSREINILLTPENGYYLEGGKNDFAAEKAVRYEKYQEALEALKEKYTIKKGICVELDTSDPYGTCTYELDGKPVSGMITVRKGQKLTLDYQITLENMQIQFEKNHWWQFDMPFLDKQNQVIEIPIETLTDGTIIRRENYLNVEEKEG